MCVFRNIIKNYLWISIFCSKINLPFNYIFLWVFQAPHLLHMKVDFLQVKTDENGVNVKSVDDTNILWSRSVLQFVVRKVITFRILVTGSFRRNSSLKLNKNNFYIENFGQFSK